MMLPVYHCITVLVLLQQVTLQTNKYTDVLKRLSYSFGLNLLECGDVANATAPMEADIYNYWDMNYELLHVSSGCLALCAMGRLRLLDGAGRLQTANFQGYVSANGADDEVSSALLQLYSECRGAPTSTSHPCAVALEVAKCFRRAVHDRRWTPDISSLLSLN